VFDPCHGYLVGYGDLSCLKNISGKTNNPARAVPSTQSQSCSCRGMVLNIDCNKGT